MLTKDSILEKVTQHKIMSDFLTMAGTTFTTTRHFKNPFRLDSNPTCSLYENESRVLMFKDHAYNHYTGDCFAVVAHYLDKINYKNNITFRDVLSYIDKHYKLGLQPSSFNVENISNDKVVNVRKKISPSEYKANVEFRFSEYANWPEHHMDYFYKYHVKVSTLQKHRVVPIHKFFYGTRLRYKTWEDSKDNPIFKYEIIPYQLVNDKFCIVDNKKFSQAYRPLAKNKKDKFRTNAHGSPMLNFSRAIECPDKTVVFITKSMKDILVFYELGFTAVAPIGESTNIPSYYLDKLENMYERIVVNYDSDAAGEIAAAKLCDKRGYENFTFYGEGIKDVSDFVKQHGLNAAKELLKDYYNNPF